MTQFLTIAALATAGIVFLGCGGDDNNCGSACAVISSCTTESTQSCLDQCQGDYNEASDFSSACAKAVDNLAACVGGLTCEELDAWFEEVPADSYPCRAEEIAIEEC
jgi:hypothetical protein